MIHNEIKARELIHREIEDDIQKYLGSGGTIQKLDIGDSSGEPMRFNNKSTKLIYPDQEP